jgi:Ribonuclease G/E
MNQQAEQPPVVIERPSTEMVVFARKGTLYCVLLESGEPVEIISQAQDLRPGAGSDASLNRHDLLLGRVRQVLPALDSAFVDIGDGHDALLPLAEAPQGIRSGQVLILQIRKKTPDHKGHRVTANLALPGPYAVFRPHAPPIRRSKLRRLPPASQEGLFQRDLERLSHLWQSLKQQSASGSVPRLLHAFGDALQMALTSWTGPEISCIRTDDHQLYQVLDQLLKKHDAGISAAAAFSQDAGRFWPG